LRLAQDVRDWFAHPITILLFRIVLAVVFLAAAFPKIRDPMAFAWAIHRYGMVPPTSLEVWFAVILPVLELWVGFALLFGFWTRGSALLTGGMLVMFIIALFSAVQRGLDIDCGCFSPESASPVGYKRILEDVGLLILCLPPLMWGSRRYGLDSLRRKSSPD
jgi:uncharacterized membrane protein YphA (DoxX/SURF4 family)